MAAHAGNAELGVDGGIKEGEPCRGSTMNNPQWSPAAQADMAELGVSDAK
jgi:hypothetical protein